MDKTIAKLNKAIGKRLALLYPATTVTLYGLAEPVLVRDHESDTTSPAIVSASGECQVVYDALDSAAITIYSHLQSIAYEESAGWGFGNSHGYSQVADVSLVVFGKRSVGQYELERALTDLLASDNYRSVQGADFNAIQVWSSEFPGVPYFINPDWFLFKINFKISTSTGRCHKQQ